MCVPVSEGVPITETILSEEQQADPGISAKTVHFPPWRDGALAPQASLAALGISTSGESAGNFGENGSLSPGDGRGTGSTGPSGRTWHFHLPGKCREFPQKRFTFPSWSVA